MKFYQLATICALSFSVVACSQVESSVAQTETPILQTPAAQTGGAPSFCNNDLLKSIQVKANAFDWLENNRILFKLPDYELSFASSQDEGNASRVFVKIFKPYVVTFQPDKNIENTCKVHIQAHKGYPGLYLLVRKQAQ